MLLLEIASITAGGRVKKTPWAPMFAPNPVDFAIAFPVTGDKTFSTPLAIFPPPKFKRWAPPIKGFKYFSLRVAFENLPTACEVFPRPNLPTPHATPLPAADPRNAAPPPIKLETLFSSLIS